jgi:hypothetical protein
MKSPCRWAVSLKSSLRSDGAKIISVRVKMRQIGLGIRPALKMGREDVARVLRAAPIASLTLWFTPIILNVCSLETYASVQAFRGLRGIRLGARGSRCSSKYMS